MRQVLQVYEWYDDLKSRPGLLQDESVPHGKTRLVHMHVRLIIDHHYELRSSRSRSRIALLLERSGRTICDDPL